jgi:SAM-dependent methyltransferase
MKFISQTEPLKSQIANNDRYYNGLKVFKSRCTDYNEASYFFQDLFYHDILGIRTALQNSADLKICDIGCGDGVVTCLLIKHVFENLRASIQLTLVEPSDIYISSTLKKLSQIKEQQLIIDTRKQYAETYFHHAYSSFDIILSSHSLYFIPTETLREVFASIKRNGFLVIIAMSQRSIMSQLKDMFSPEPTITADVILEFMQAEGFASQYAINVIQRKSLLDMNGISLGKKHELSEPAKNLLSLMIQKDIDDINGDEYERVRAVILPRLNNARLELESSYIVARKSC